MTTTQDTTVRETIADWTRSDLQVFVQDLITQHRLMFSATGAIAVGDPSPSGWEKVKAGFLTYKVDGPSAMALLREDRDR